jgi:hypothetical protein
MHCLAVAAGRSFSSSLFDTLCAFFLIALFISSVMFKNIFCLVNLDLFLSEFRLHAQALTLAALAGAALVEYFDHKSGAKAEQYAKFVPPKD